MSSEFNFQAWWNGEPDNGEDNQSEAGGEVEAATKKDSSAAQPVINPPPDVDYRFKLLLVGDSAVGKSCLLQRFVNDAFTENYISTIGVDFMVSSVTSDGKRIKLQIWDTAGQERFRTITTSYYRGANGILIAFDITNEESFKKLKDWLKEVDMYAPDTTVKMMVGTKSDLQFQRAVDYETAKTFADEHNLQYSEVSSKDSSGVEQVFMSITNAILNQNEI